MGFHLCQDGTLHQEENHPASAFPHFVLLSFHGSTLPHWLWHAVQYSLSCIHLHIQRSVEQRKNSKRETSQALAEAVGEAQMAGCD